MKKKVLSVLALSILIVSCQAIKDKEQAQAFSKEFAEIQEQFRSKMPGVKSEEEYRALLQEKNKKFADLLKKYEKSPATDEIEILRSKALLNMGKNEDAEKRIDAVIQKGGDFINEAKMVKVLVLFANERVDEAVPIFREIETGVKRGEDFFNAHLYFAFRAADAAVREEYAQKFIAADDVPEELAGFKPRLYGSLAADARGRGDMEKAAQLFKKAIAMVKNPAHKAALEAELAQLEFIGRPAPAISAETWVNSNPLSLDKLKGKPVIVDFWATWCKPCRIVAPVLNEMYGKHKDAGLVVIGFTKLYGSYTDELGNKGKVSKAQEIDLIKEYVNRNKIGYPVAISNEGLDFDKYKIAGIPTMVLIDKEGRIKHIEVGVDTPEALRNRIEKFLEAK